jgi:uncharacterized repeat protein (TIGR01451 family)
LQQLYANKPTSNIEIILSIATLLEKMQIKSDQAGNFLQGLLVFLAVFFLFIFPNPVAAQNAMVTWGNNSGNLNPTILNGQPMGAQAIQPKGGITAPHTDWTGVRVNNFHGGGVNTINYSKYLEFKIVPNDGYKAILSQFRLTYNSPSGNGATKMQVRYSTNPSFPSNGTVLDSEKNLTTGSNQNLIFNFPADYEISDTLYMRMYLFGHSNLGYSDFYILTPRKDLNNLNLFVGPTVWGSTILASSTVAFNDVASTAQNFPVTVNILSNDNYSNLAAINITQQPINGSVVVNGLSSVTYTPNNNYSGSDSFKYTITDENGTSEEATVNISVTPPVAPTAVADNFFVLVNSPTEINVLANDNQGSGPFDQITIVSNPSNGFVSVNPDKTITYTPNNNYAGNDLFQYQVTNVHGGTSNIVNVNLTVNYTGLVVWDGQASGFAPKYNINNITASNMSSIGPGDMTNEGQYNPYFLIDGWPKKNEYGGGINPEKYLQFTLSPVGSYKIDLDQFNLSLRLQGGNGNYEIRYSKNSNFNTFHSSSGGLTNSQSNLQIDLTPIGVVAPGETLYIRLYAYNTNNKLIIMHNWGGGSGPTIRGSVSPISMADLAIDKLVNNPTPNVNDPVVFTINIQNNGPTNATNVEVTDLLPSGYQFVSASSGSFNQATGKWSVGSLASGASNSLSITAKVLKSGEYTNTASVTSSQGDSNLLNNSSSVNITPVHPDVGVSLTVNNATPNAGDNVTFTVSAYNNGPGTATGITVNSLLPSGFTYVSSNPSVGSYNQNSGVWTIGALSNAESATLQLVAKVKSSGDFDHSATIAIAENDVNASNNSATVEVDPVISSIDLGISMVVDNTNPSVGQNVIFSITINNLGGIMANGVEVISQLPSGYTYVSNNSSIGNYNQATGIWSVGSLAAGGNATLTITAQRLATGSYTNTAVVSHNNFDPNATNNNASVGLAFGCDACTHPVTGGAIVVNAGEVYCLESGSWSGGVTMNGGTLCVSPGATMTVNYINGELDGVIKNNGTITNFPMISGASKHLTIINFGSIVAPYLQTFSGELFNYGTMNISGQFSTLNGSVIHNYGDLNARQISFNGSTLINHNEGNFIISHGVTVEGGDWENKLGGTVHFQGTSNSNVNFQGNIDNLGYWEFGRISGISSTLNNYGEMKVHHTASNISSTTYITNDGLLEFINVAEVQYNGPMLTNNGTLTISHPTSGNFKMNQSINQVHNNGLISITGEFQQNAAGNILVNNCTIDCKTFFVGNGNATNNGLINSFGTSSTGGRPDGLVIEGSSSFFISGKTGFTQGMNFRNSGHISGYGVFYFTGNTNNNSAGSFIGSSATEQILFYDASPSVSGLFDAPGATTQNVIRPDAMSPQELSSYNCEAPPTYAGSPPITLPYSTIVCDPADLLSISFHIDDYATPAEPVAGDPFVLLLNTIKLFDNTNLSNPTNNTTSLTIPGKGTLQVDALGQFTFIPDPSFTAGVFEAEYRISNKRSGDVVTYPSPKTKITIKLININLPDITAAGNSNEVCVGSTLALSNLIEGGVWSSSNTSVATIDETGIVTGLAIGTTMISYTKTEESCSDTVQFELTVKNCPAPSSKLISNPMIRQRIGGGN